MLGISPVVLLLAYPLGSNLRRIAHPQLRVELREQASNQRECPVASILTRTLIPFFFSSR